MPRKVKEAVKEMPINKPVTSESIKQILLTLIPFALIIAAMGFFDHWIAYIILVPMGSVFLLRTFIIQHDCGHQAFFRKKKTNNVLGSIMGVITLIPYHYWRWQHWMHHRGSGNLDKRGHGDIVLLTVEEYKSKSWLGRLGYRAYRNPFIMCGLGPLYYFFIKIRFPFIMEKKQKAEKRSIFYTNFGIAALMGLLWLFSWKLVVLYVVLSGLAFAIGILLFYIQHNYEGAYWTRTSDWSFKKAALQGSSYFKLPRILDWFSGYISHHHVHHLDSKIPFYRLKEYMAKHEYLQHPVVIKMRDVRKAFAIKLFDEERNQMITFKGFRKLMKEGELQPSRVF